MKNLILEEPEAYEVNIGGHRYRRPGDPPLEEVAGGKEWVEEQMKLQAKRPPPERRIPASHGKKKKKKSKKAKKEGAREGSTGSDEL